MYPHSKPVPYQVLHLLIPAIAFVGNGAVVYVTIRSNVRSDTVSSTTCIYLQLPSTFAACTSPMFLLAAALDRRLCLMRFYNAMLASYPKYYLAAQILPACIIGIALDVAVLINLKTEQQVICSLATPMMGPISSVYTKAVMIVCMIIILSNASFILFLRKLRMSSETAKSAHRSVFLICMTVVLGYFSAMVIFFMRELLNLDVDLLNWSTFAGLFAYVSFSVNFFVYYTISKEYRAAFDELLGIGRVKAFLCRRKRIGDQQLPNLPSTSRNNIVAITVSHAN
uniref:G_PROTEIN_RECEP_F1_2 domain-containing protein n=1 Tax=Haemonchus contortus TaxID=6289 RepID=A0A7I4YRN1_HAECO